MGREKRSTGQRREKRCGGGQEDGGRRCRGRDEDRRTKETGVGMRD